MNWRKLKGWQKGAIIGSLFGVLVLVITLLSPSKCFDSSGSSLCMMFNVFNYVFFSVPGFVTWIISFIFGFTAFETSPMSFTEGAVKDTVFALIFIATYSIIGMIISLIFKGSKKKDKQRRK